MGKLRTSLLALRYFLALGGLDLYARDIPEPIEAVDPLAGIDETSPLSLPLVLLIAPLMKL